MKYSMLTGIASVLAMGSLAFAQVPQGYPAGYQQIIDAAKAEKRLVIYSSTDQASAQFLLDDFKKLYPFIEIEYNDIGTQKIYDRLVSEAAAGSQSADFLWSSGLELQVKLVADGYALPYDSPEAKRYPKESKLDNLAYGTTLEPAVLVYNKRFVKPEQVPSTRAEFAKLLEDPKYAGKVGTWDPEKSAIGFALLKEDSESIKDFPLLAQAFGKVGVSLYSASGNMLEKVISGEHFFAYDVIGSYALLRQQTVKDLGFTYWKDQTVAFQRIAFINKNAARPNAAKLFLDYLLSLRGQNIMANNALLFALRDSVVGEATPKSLYQGVGGRQNVVVIPVSRELLKNLEPADRSRFFNFWRQAIKAR